MRLVVRLFILLYIMSILLVFSWLLIFALDGWRLREVYSSLYLYSQDKDFKTGLAVWSGVILFMTYFSHRLLLLRIKKDKLIAFDNPSGRVSVSVSALEDLVKRMLNKVIEIKESKCMISAVPKKGLQVKIKLNVRVDGSIPEFTSRIQDKIRRKLQDTIGLDEPVVVTIDIGKIMVDQKETRITEPKAGEETQPHVPYRDYRS